VSTFASTALIARVEKTVRRQLLFKPGDTLVVAFSGGADSTALLDLLTRLPDFNLHLVAAHLNHCLRGDESDADEQFCRAEAQRHGVPIEVRRCDVAALAVGQQRNLEDAGRRARIAFLDEVSRTYGATAVVLAHHADDQAETVLMRLLRGSGMTGLSGMAYCNSRGYVRPLLDITRAEIELYLRECGIGWREDASNSDTVYLRNRIRHDLLPLLETYNPAIRTTLAATAPILGGDEALLEELTAQSFSETCRIEEGRVVCAIGKLTELSPPLRRRVLRMAFKQATGTLEGLSHDHIEAVGDLLTSDRPNARCLLPRGMTAIREYDRLVVMKAGDEPAASGFELLITELGEYHLPGGGYLVVEKTPSGQLPEDQDSALCDLKRTPLPWLVRSFLPGDRIVPFGMSGRKKVKDIFIDRKIPLSDRRRIPLLLSGENLLWIAGLCASELCRIDAGSTAPVRVTWRKPHQ
jgi:tRNA(Ile)-lysidine synthase